MDTTANNHKMSKQKKKGKPPPPPGSESDQSVDTNSLSAESQEAGRSPSSTHKITSKKGEWEILEGLKEGQRFDFVPRKFEGFLLKRRKWPLKGWHKRYFVLDRSVLTYAKSVGDLMRGKILGRMDIGMSVISTKARRRRIDIDADTLIFHLKCKSREVYLQWVEQLKQHRLHKQHQILYSKDQNKLTSPTSPSDDSPTAESLVPGGRTSLPGSLPGSHHGTMGRETKTGTGTTLTGAAADADPIQSPCSPLYGVCLSCWGGFHPHNSMQQGAGTLRSWLMDNSGLEQLGKEITTTHHHVQQLARLLDSIEHQDDVSHGEPATPSTKSRRKFRLRKHKSSKSTSGELPLSASPGKGGPDQVDAAVPSLQVDGNLCELRPLSSSNPTLAMHNAGWHSSVSRPHSYSDASTAAGGSQPPNTPSPTSQSHHPAPIPPTITLSMESTSREDFTILAKEIVSQIGQVLRGLQTEREKLRQALESESNLLASHNTTAIIAALRNNLNQSLQQNAELRGRLARIHADSDLSEVSVPPSMSELLHKSLHTSLSYESSSCFSASEYFDAADAFSDAGATDTSSEASSDNSSFTSEASDAGTDAHPSVADSEDVTAEIEEDGKCFTGRRTRLPAPKPLTEDFSVWNFLYKNIGKDLSKVSMPVTLNEPLNLLQRMCEELEYSELLDKAAGMDDAGERMVLVASFAVSAYASSIYRAAHKPFNPLLGESFECIREDKGFRFVAEQVSHHPPVSACYAKSHNFTFWQDVRIKTKFWGRSLEFQPTGKVHLVLREDLESVMEDHYEWNKVTTCVHNLFGGGQRWVDQYGEMIIKNTNKGLTCKMSFVRASSWSSKRHEVFGSVTDSSGQVLHNLFGKWTEALYCGHAPSAKVVWRPGSMPEDFHLYFGFTRFAMELNELDEDQAKYLPPTDTRFRPDQRYLEEGNMSAAELLKTQLEQQQRERRKQREEKGEEYVPMWFRREQIDNNEESWVFTGEYWNKRKDPGFVNMTFDKLW
ncbi:oxysterol-binding protein-related protein 3-like isoform X4 [Eriocheir sinensis]|uniref:oxysterol-binding protein-related protein 3-like isoform X4 n=1 Tax=Eriocheir sinensis TaxID=95602 RepID=UPI0021CAC651|nr:oxysterol-binding protein-related protein 3-like isoform X4 [Eriocheir sinensis]